MPLARMAQESEALRNRPEVTLRWLSPLRMPRPKASRQSGHAHLDREAFDSAQFARRVLGRARSMGLRCDLPDSAVASALSVAENRLVWIDFEYGPRDDRTSLGGCGGWVRLRVADQRVIPALVVGQYLRVGQNTRFGLGNYRIGELGRDPTAPARSIGLLELAMRDDALARAAEKYDLPSGAARSLARRVTKGTHQPSPCVRVEIPKPLGGCRVLAIPALHDRVIQRALHDVLAPALDLFFESSSLAYRRGLGRSRAASMIRSAYREGYRHALRSDFARFFDSIGHGLLRDRLEAYLCDEIAVEYLMRCVKSGSPFEDRGIPTGSPLSPLLSNLFLDEFDERIAAEGGRLVRYADDFVTLYRTREQAAAALEPISRAAQSLALSLNQSKCSTADVGSSFEFLGFTFEKRGRWEVIGPHQGSFDLEDLGWKQARRDPPSVTRLASLPAEHEAPAWDHDSSVVAGPGVERLDFHAQRLRLHLENTCRSIPVGRIRDVLILGECDVERTALLLVRERGIRLTICSDTGLNPVEVVPAGYGPDAEVLRAQDRLADDSAWSLAVARRLIRAKILNYSRLAASLDLPGTSPAAAAELALLGERCSAAVSMESLRGVEGAAAAQWFDIVAGCLPAWCRWEGRVAPAAADPANILLNIAYTTLHRHAAVAARNAGLATSIGALHAPRPGHEALASDLMEPFRHLMDRAALHALRQFRPADFREGSPDDPYPLMLVPRAAKNYVGLVLESLSLGAAPPGGGPAISYLAWLGRMARSLRAHLLDRSRLFEVFEHP